MDYQCMQQKKHFVGWFFVIPNYKTIMSRKMDDKKNRAKKAMKNKIAVHKKRRKHVQKNLQEKLSSEIMYNQAKEDQKSCKEG